MMRWLCTLTMILLPLLATVRAEDTPRNPLLGDWALVSAEGGKLAFALKNNVRRVQVDSERITAGRSSEYSIDVNKKEIDLEIEGGPKEEQGTYKGIFELNNGKLRLHFALAGKPRPTSFTPSEQSILITLSKGM